MDFFKSVFSSEESPPHRSAFRAGAGEDEEEMHESQSPSAAAASGGITGGGAWSFGGLMKTIASRSETVIQTYRRDLEEFGSGLRKETAFIREAATRAVLDLPGSLESGASAAHDSLETVGQAIDDLGGTLIRGTAEIISHGKEALLAIDASDSNSSDLHYLSDSSSHNVSASSSKKYSRFELQMQAVQADLGTFAEEPEDEEEFVRWCAGFDLAEKEEDIETLLHDNVALEGIFQKLVPSEMDHETFWCRYYYRVHKFRLVEDARANLVRRAISGEEEDLTWEVDDEDQFEETMQQHKLPHPPSPQQEDKAMEKNEDIEEALQEDTNKEEQEKVTETENISTLESEKQELPSEPPVYDKEVEGVSSPAGVVDAPTREELMRKDSDVSVVSSQPSIPEEDDLGWDEIEDLGEHDDKQTSGTRTSTNRDDIRKRLSTAEEDEDLSWDIEDDTEPSKT